MTAPAETFHPQVAIFYNTEIPNDIERGATLVDGVWTNPAPEPLIIEGTATVVEEPPAIV